MTTVFSDLVTYRELIATLAWKNIAVRYKQAYFGIVWAVIKPITLMLVFVLLRAFVGIETGAVPYPVLAFAALLIWILFQESASEGIQSIVGNAHLIRKIYFPREVFPITAVITKLTEFGINFVVLVGMMAWFGIWPTAQALWVPLIVLYAVMVGLTIALLGAAINVHYRDVSAAVPVLLSLAMYVSPVIYPLALVQDKLLVKAAVGEWSKALYLLYTLNPLAGIIDAFQRVLLLGKPPDMSAIWPGLVLTLIALPISYAVFKRAETYFADVI